MTAREFLVKNYCGFYDEGEAQEIDDISTVMEEYAQHQVKLFAIPDVNKQRELLLSAICQFTKRNTQKEIQEVEKWIETDYRN